MKPKATVMLTDSMTHKTKMLLISKKVENYALDVDNTNKAYQQESSPTNEIVQQIQICSNVHRNAKTIPVQVVSSQKKNTKIKSMQCLK